MSEEYQRGYAEGYESGALDIHKAVRRAEAAESRAAELLERVDKLEASFQAERQELSKSISLIVQGYSATEEKLNEQVTDLTAQNARLSGLLKQAAKELKKWMHPMWPWFSEVGAALEGREG